MFLKDLFQDLFFFPLYINDLHQAIKFCNITLQMIPVVYNLRLLGQFHAKKLKKQNRRKLWIFIAHIQQIAYIIFVHHVILNSLASNLNSNYFDALNPKSIKTNCPAPPIQKISKFTIFKIKLSQCPQFKKYQNKLS